MSTLNTREYGVNLPIGNRSLALIVAIAMQFGAGGRAFAATTNVVVSSFTFSPSAVTIHVGDSVKWSGLSTIHNVQTDTDPFCGSPPVSGGTCTHTFNQAGTFNYYCRPHRSIGMVGTVTVQQAAGAPPSVTITNPATGAVFAAPANLTVQASVADTDGSVTNVQFFANGAAVGSAAAVPFSVVASNLAAGNFALTAIAFDNSGLATTSPVVNISVVAPVDIMLSAPLISNGQIQLNYSANAGLRYVVENSSNFVTWTSVTTNVATSASVPYGEAFNVNVLRFYRVGRLPNP